VRFRAPILVKLLLALVLPALLLFTLFAFVAYEVSRRDLDEEVGRRLEAIASSAATQIRGKYLAVVDDAGFERAHQKNLNTLKVFETATGAHLYVFDKQLDSRVDTDPKIAVGSHYYHVELDRTELARVWDRGKTVASVTFEGLDGVTYKAGYAPVRSALEGDDGGAGEVVLAIAAEAPAVYFTRLADLKRRLLLWGAGLLVVSMIAAVIATLLITRNVRRLAAAAERIGAGDLLAPVEQHSHDELGVLAQTMDRMRIQLAERDARMQQMLAGIAHEVRNPLAGMTLFAGILQDELPESDERRGHVDRIRKELGYLERVVNEFLEFARRARPELAPVPLDELFAEVAQLASSETVTVAADAHDLTATADKSQLRRALLNLAKNAVQAATAADRSGSDVVRISAEKGDGELLLRVWNRGKEISPETSGKLFEPFFTTREKGTGLGLAFVREIAMDHGGRVEVTSADGETTFTIALPV
jgi:signal transduction histidine kinase